MIFLENETDAIHAGSRLARLLSKTGLAKKTAHDFVKVCIMDDKRYAVGIVALLLHAHCLRYRKYRDNESLTELVKDNAVKAKLSDEDTIFLLNGLG